MSDEEGIKAAIADAIADGALKGVTSLMPFYRRYLALRCLTASADLDGPSISQAAELFAWLDAKSPADAEIALHCFQLAAGVRERRSIAERIRHADRFLDFIADAAKVEHQDA